MTENQDFPKGENALKEEEILELWERGGVFQKTLEKESPEGEFIFYEGPPGANGRPGIHHVISRVFKDAFPRYKTMRGFHVRRKAGWDTHGLPVELEVEKQLGFTSKKDIETYGVEAFNEKCKESVWKYVDEWKDLTRRIGYWVDLDDAYVTYYPEFIESVWNIVEKINDRGLLYKDYKVVPWCPRCGTGLSSHELAQGYADVKDISVYIKFKVKGQDNTYILAWTTTPWTLPGNAALAVGEDIDYSVWSVKDLLNDSEEKLIFATDLTNKILGSDVISSEGSIGGKFVRGEPGSDSQKEFTLLERKKGSDLVGLEYEPLFPYLSDLIPDKESLSTAFKVYPADFVTTTDGTGIVHTAVMYGQDDFELGTKVGLPKFHLVDETGHFIDGMGEFSGLPVKEKVPDGQIDDTAKLLLKKLEDLNKEGKGGLFGKEKVTHTYPHCWRCKTPLIYYARDSWYIRMSDLRDDLVKENQKINWVPEHIRDGRFGEWLREVKDWAVSRDRYWGTPLPVWNCLECNEREVIGSVEQLLKRQKKSGNRYIVMRHGEAFSNAKNVLATIAGGENDKITDKGKEQTLEAVKKLAGEKIDAIIVSPFTRTRDTADIVAAELGITDVVVDEAIGEMKAGTYDGKTMYEWGAFLTGGDWYTKRPEGGESHADVAQRMAKFIFDLDSNSAYQGKTILIITHGGPAQMLFGVSARVSYDRSAEHMKRFNTTAEFHELPFVPYPHNKQFELDLHKPYIDDVILECAKCKNDMRRTTEVMDVWFDSGAMPLAQDHYPFDFAQGGPFENKKLGYPADYISEAIDQTRGWFYTLHAVGTLIGRGLAFKNVICLGHILDAQGKKMSKSLGNVLNPWELIAKYGIDVIRFWMFAVNQPGDTKNFDEKTVVEMQNKVFTLLRNVVKFYKLYETDDTRQTTDEGTKTPASQNVLDQWIVALLHKLIADVTENMEAYDTFSATRAIREFVGDLSTWYIRRSRDRFKAQTSADGTRTDAEAALATTRYVVLELSKLLAPFTPFFAEELYTDMGGEKESVHLESWTDIKPTTHNQQLLDGMTHVRDVVSLALEKRASAGVKIRQPLASLTIRGAEAEKLQDNAQYIELIKDELNVKEVLFDRGSGWEVELDTNITPELKREGDVRELIRSIQEFRKQSNLTPSDTVALIVTTNAEGKELIESARDEIMKSATLSAVTVEEGDSGFVFRLE